MIPSANGQTRTHHTATQQLQLQLNKDPLIRDGARTGSLESRRGRDGQPMDTRFGSPRGPCNGPVANHMKKLIPVGPHSAWLTSATNARTAAVSTPGRI